MEKRSSAKSFLRIKYIAMDAQISVTQRYSHSHKLYYSCCCIQHACIMQRHAYAASSTTGLGTYYSRCNLDVSPISEPAQTPLHTQPFKPSRKNVRGCKWRDLARKRNNADAAASFSSFSFFSQPFILPPHEAWFCGVFSLSKHTYILFAFQELTIFSFYSP